jgi:hypothetical protein
MVLYKFKLNQHNTDSNFKPATLRNKDYLFHEVSQRKLHLIFMKFSKYELTSQATTFYEQS